MAATTTQAGSRRRAAVFALSACLLAGALLAVSGIGSAGQARADLAKEVGKTARTPNPSCPTPSANNFPDRKGCEVLGEVTGFQLRADGKRGLMKVPADGRIVGWSVDLAKPNRSERNFFADVLGDRAFDGAPSARLQMLKRLRGQQYRLKRTTPSVVLSSLMGRRQYFTLNDPISVQKGWIAALASRTWVPSFAHHLNNGDKWRASRAGNRCEGFKNLTERSKPHGEQGSKRAYGCTYSGARIIYWAYFQAT